mgnify:CR=1 FL=1
MAGIKETPEAIALIGKTADAIIAAKADGSIDWKDLVKLGPVIVAMKAAVDGGNLIPEELKDLDAAETDVVWGQLWGAVGKLITAVIG